jgi:DNA-binding YbaB/EbfC family protein
MGSGYSKMKKQQKAMQSQMADMQKDLEGKEIVGASEGDLVKVTLSGTKVFKKITINPDCVDSDDVEGLEDLIASAFKDAEKKAGSEMGMGDMGGFF